MLRFNAIEGVQEGAEKSLAGQGIDGAMVTFGTDLPLTSDLARTGTLLVPLFVPHTPWTMRMRWPEDQERVVL